MVVPTLSYGTKDNTLMFNELLTNLISYIGEVSGDNQLLAAALMGSISIFISGLVGFVLWKIPTKILATIKNQCFTVFRIGTHQWNSQDVYENLNAYIYENRLWNLSRSISIATQRKTKDNSECNYIVQRFGLGLGWHVFLHNNRIFVAFKQRTTQTGGNALEELFIYSLGRSVSYIDNLIKHNLPVIKEDDVLLYQYGKEGWKKQTTIKMVGGLDSLALSSGIREFFTKETEFYLGNQDRYYELGLPWKITFMLHGEPGTGKTSIIRAIASTYGFNVCVINLKDISYGGLTEAVSTIPERSILLFEDCDGSPATNSRDNKGGDITLLEPLSVDLQGFLNILDGVSPLDDVLVFMTTNYIDRIDDAIFRKGRTDHIIELPKLEPDVVNEYLNRVYKTTGFNATRPMLACELNEIKNRAKLNSDLAKDIVSGEFREHSWRKRA